MTFFFWGLNDISSLVRTGKLDLWLIKPANSLFVLSCRFFNHGAFVNFLLGVGIVIYAFIKLSLSVTFFQIVEYIVLCLNGVLISYCIFLAFMTLSFWIVETNSFIDIFVKLNTVSEKPGRFFGKYVFVIFTYIIPVFVISNYPARCLLYGFNWFMLIHSFIISILAILFVRYFFNKGLKRYTSAGG